uniref:MICOS complex subunit mic25a-like n=1 Tax=Gouania willdenowi TaxID=441366 RepID=A0A8C5GN67_GOUWI
MGGNGSTARKVSFGLGEDEKVTVIEGVKLSDAVLRQMKETQGDESSKSPPPAPPDDHKTQSDPKPTDPPTTDAQEEMRKTFERQQALVQEQLAKLAQCEKEAAAAAGLEELMPALIMERGKVHEEKEKVNILPADLDTWAKQLERKEQQLANLSSFYKEQLQILEKRNIDNYKETTEQYCREATKTEARIRPRQNISFCADLQAKVLQCYRENPQQTLHCSSLAKHFIDCVEQAKKSSPTNHG